MCFPVLLIWPSKAWHRFGVGGSPGHYARRHRPRSSLQPDIHDLRSSAVDFPFSLLRYSIFYWPQTLMILSGLFKRTSHASQSDMAALPKHRCVPGSPISMVDQFKAHAARVSSTKTCHATYIDIGAIMSSTNSGDYYHSASRGRPSGQSLPPLRSVLGDQLALPVTHSGYQSPYDLGEISEALPPAGSGYGNTSRSTPKNTSFADSRHSHEHSYPHRPYTYPPSSAYPSRQPRSMTPTYDEYNSVSHSPPNSSSSKSTNKKYACSWEGCDKRFERRHALDTHMNIHLEQKPFACPVPFCGKVFNVRSNMRRHLLTHKDSDTQGSGQLSHEDDFEDEERASGDFQTSRHGSAIEGHRRSSEHHLLTAPPAQRYYSSARRA